MIKEQSQVDCHKSEEVVGANARCCASKQRLRALSCHIGVEKQINNNTRGDNLLLFIDRKFLLL